MDGMDGKQERRIGLKKLLLRMVSLVLVMSMAALLFSGCSGGGEDSSGFTEDDYPVTVGNVQFDHSPTGVVVLSPSLADIVLATNYELSLVGRSEECTQEDLAVLPTVGNATAVSTDAIIALSPELVLTDQALSEEQTQTLQSAGIQVLVLQSATTREEIEVLYANVGSILGGAQTGNAKAVKVAQSIFKSLDDINRGIPESEVLVTACYLYDLDGQAATGDTLGGKLIEYAGAVNVLSDSQNGRYERQSLVLGNPTYIFCQPGVKSQLEQDEELSQLAAVQEGRVFEMESSLMQWQGYTLMDAVIFMAGSMYPELLENSSSQEASSEPSSEEGTDSQPSSDASSEAPSDSSSQQDASSQASSSSGQNPFPAGTVLQYGDTGENVTKLQQRLYDLRYLYNEPNGTFDDATQEAVVNFQFQMTMDGKYNHLADGVANDELFELLFADDVQPRV